ncbi:tyrosine-type recombinase/integrase [Microbacterium sp.]|uniref:tyrosine-type recombinase/integrase n=1 Tax=Microbacterium sp. TaxID=51671 RepID=UPI003F7296A9
MSIQKLSTGKYRARYRDATGKEHSRHFALKRDAEEHLARESASRQAGVWIPPDLRRITVAEWADRWVEGYSVNRPGTVRSARTHLVRIKGQFGTARLADLKPSDVKTWMAELQAEGLADSTRYALHRRLSQLYADAIHEGLVTRSPTSRRTSPKQGAQRPYVATTEQVWALHDALPVPMRGAVLLGAFAGLRAGEMVALTMADVDFMRGVVTPRVQYSEGTFEGPLKTPISATPIPVPPDLTLSLQAVPREYGTVHLVVSMWGQPITPARLDVHFKRAVRQVPSLPDAFRLHDLRHYFASMLIASGLDIKTVQARVRHASAKTTLDVYGHLWPDRDDSTRAALAAAMRRPEPAPALAVGGAQVLPLTRRGRKDL